MPQYEVKKSPGIQFPVGHVFETDALHPSMFQFVQLMRGKKTPVAASAAKTEKDEGPSPEDLIGEGYIHDEDVAFDLASAEYVERNKPPKPTEKPTAAKKSPVVKDNKGPGENS